MQKNYVYTLTEPPGKNFHPDFERQLTPKEMLELGVFRGKYMTDRPWISKLPAGANSHVGYPFGMSDTEITAEAGPDDPRRIFIITLARALHQVGFSSHYIENRLKAFARRLDLTLEIMALPTGIMLTIFEGTRPETYLLRERQTGVNLERMSLLIQSTNHLIADWVTPQQAKLEIDAIMQSPERWGPPSTISAYILSSGAFAVFFGGGANELLVATLVGIVAGVTSVVMRRWVVTTRLFELVAAAGAGLTVQVASQLIGSCVEWIPLAAGLIILLPGISLLDSVTELSHGLLVSGGARLAGVIVAFLALAFGAMAGSSIDDFLPPNQVAEHPEPLGWGATYAALIVVAVGSTIRFRARPRDFAIILAATALAYYAARFDSEHLSQLAGAFLAAFLLGLAGNAFAKFARGAAELVVIPGIALLVPGSVGIQSLSALLSQNAIVGIEAAFEMFLIAMALAAGILFSQSFVSDSAPTL
jgi:uncharacterized membrane protein YjjP (DUF1212 family)